MTGYHRRDVIGAGIAAVVIVGGTLFLALLVNSRQPVPSPDITPATLAIVSALNLGGCATIAVRRRWPRSALAVATALVLTCVAVRLSALGPGIALIVCGYTMSSLFPPRRSVPVLAGLTVLHAAGGILVSKAGGDVRGLPTFWGVPGQDLDAMLFATAASYGIPGGVGATVRRRRAHTAALTGRAERLEAERDERDRVAAAEERSRLARELHDIAAHDLSAIVVQAGAADRLVDADPDAAKVVLRNIRGQGRETLAALRQLVGIMRDDDTGGRAPQPGLARIGDLVTVARDAGMTVEVRVCGEPGPLPLQADLAAYRVVQESLTNARRHAPRATVRLELVHDEGVRITVHNAPAVLPADEDATPGQGLAGMRERVRRAGGHLSAGPAPDGGWLVAAHLPAHPPGDGAA